MSNEYADGLLLGNQIIAVTAPRCASDEWVDFLGWVDDEPKFCLDGSFTKTDPRSC